jgi:hypothetical protein
MWLQTERIGDVTLLVPSRFLLGGPDLERLEGALDDLVAAGQRKALLDLVNVQILTSLAIKGLLRLQTRAIGAGITLCLCDADRILQVPAQFWIRRLFTVFDDREAGLQELAVGLKPQKGTAPPP